MTNIHINIEKSFKIGFHFFESSMRTKHFLFTLCLTELCGSIIVMLESPKFQCLISRVKTLLMFRFAEVKVHIQSLLPNIITVRVCVLSAPRPPPQSPAQCFYSLVWSVTFDFSLATVWSFDARCPGPGNFLGFLWRDRTLSVCGLF